jgi:TctA family transporter
MFPSQQRTTGVNYTPAIMFLVLGLVFVPAFLLFLGAWDFFSLASATFFGSICLMLGWRTWHTQSRLTIPSILTRIGRSR